MHFLRRSCLKPRSLLLQCSKISNGRFFTKISTILDLKPVGNRLTVQGWVKSMRKMKAVTFIDVSDGSTSDKLQVALPRGVVAHYDVGASVKVSGIVQRITNKDQLELRADNVEVIGPCKYEDGYPFVPKASHPMEHIRHHLHFRPRTNIFGSILRIRSSAANAFRNHLNDQGFFEVNAPILTSCDCEGAGEVFSVKPYSQNLLKKMVKEGVPVDDAFFGSKTFLTVSGQMHLEAAARALGCVYTFGPTFRAENSKSRLHLSEFYMLETEEVLFDGNIEAVISTIEKMLRSVTQKLLDNNHSDLEAIKKVQALQKKSDTKVVEYEVDPLDVEVIHNIFLSSASYKVMTYKEAVEILSSSKECFRVKPSFEKGLSKEHELFLVKNNGSKPIFVVEWPPHLKAFYMKGNQNSTTVAALDLLVPVVGELCGGSVREENVDILSMKLKQMDLEQKLSWYLDLRKFGNVSTGGFGMGFERYLQCLLNVANIKDVTPFPRWPHNCQM